MADRFQTTRWSLVLTAAQGGEGSVEALEWLCKTYWHPLYGFIRRQGHDAETARDLTQSFFLSLLDRNSLQRIDRREGKFRSFLLASAKHFLSHEKERQDALKRRADHPHFRLDFEGAENWYLREGRPDRVLRTCTNLAGHERSWTGPCVVWARNTRRPARESSSAVCPAI